MSTRQMLTDSAERIFADHCTKALLDGAQEGEFPGDLWAVLKENGFAELATSDSGFELGEAFAVLKVEGRHAAPLPLAEIMLGNRWLGSADRLVSVGLVDGDVVRDVPWGRRADAVIALDPSGGPPSVLEVTQVDSTGSNLAGEARDVLALTAALPLGSNEPGLELLALARVAQMAGALERILELTLRYANEREQFGRPIARFQAIQHNLAVMAAEVAAAVRIADAAVDALGGERFEFEVAAAKSRVGEAAGVCAESAHQIHGAMGFTHEHQLHHFTRRVWAWREEFGNEIYWRRRLGDHIAGLGADAVWDFLATRG